MFKKIIRFVKEEVWNIQIANQPLNKSIPIRIIRVVLLAIKGFREDQVQIRASALTLFTLLSIVPMVAMAFGIAQLFGFEKNLESQLMDYFAGQKEVMEWILQFAQSFLANIKGGVIVGIGALILFWSVISVLSNIEKSFNAIWQVKKSRIWLRKFTDYISIMLMGIIFIPLSSSATVYISTQVSNITSKVEILDYISPLFMYSMQYLPYLVMWLLLTIIYMVMPNTQVKFKSALIAGIIAGSVFQLTQWGYIHFQIGVSRYGAVYGSFAAFPLFLIWLQISWLIILLGAEIAFADQNVKDYEFESESKNISNSYKKIIALAISHVVIKNFENGNIPISGVEIAQKLELPIRLVKRTIAELVDANIINVIISEDNKSRHYQPALDIAKIDVALVLNSLDDSGSNKILLPENKAIILLQEKLNAIKSNIETSKMNILLKEL